MKPVRVWSLGSDAEFVQNTGIVVEGSLSELSEGDVMHLDFMQLFSHQFVDQSLIQVGSLGSLTLELIRKLRNPQNMFCM
jgi:hypothetical protein